MDRLTFNKRLIGLILVPLLVVLAACTSAPTPAPTPTPLGTVEVLGVWGGEELASFQAMVAPWQQQTKGTMQFTGTRDLTAVLTTRIQAGNPPDIAILPNPGLMAELAKAGNLIPLSSFLNMSQINQDYSKGWVDLGTVNAKLYALFIKASDKGTVWYNPKVFTANGWKVPNTWDEMIALSNQIVAEKKVPPAPWSVAVESG